jgi:UDP-N-acetylmuramate--alanine ligase
LAIIRKDRIKMTAMRHVKQIHFVGIGGAGMSGIAEVLLQQGYQVSGSDRQASATVTRLQQLGAKVFIGHEAAHIDGADVVVQSTAIAASNCEITAAIAARIPVVPRAEMLGELMRFRQGIAVAGTHGKTTTTSLCTTVLANAGMDPTYIIGGQLNSANTNARLGTGKYLVAEADESDASFLYLQPMMAIVTNIDVDHMETYGNDVERLKQTFLQFLHRLPFYGLAIVCIDDPIIREILPRISRPVITYGFSKDADICALNFVQQGVTSSFEVRRFTKTPNLKVNLNMAGRHNVLNALAVIALANELVIDDGMLLQALHGFRGVQRRFNVYPELQFPAGAVTLVDDYGHHPRELEVTIAAARAAWPGQRLVMLFQPHRYSRTQALFNEFAEVLGTVDQCLLLDVYSAGEAPIEGISSAALCQHMQTTNATQVLHVSDAAKLTAQLDGFLKPGDVLIAQGAGSIGAIAEQLLQQYRVGEVAAVL